MTSAYLAVTACRLTFMVGVISSPPGYAAPAVAIRAAVQMLLTVLGLPRAAWWIWVIACR